MNKCRALPLLPEWAGYLWENGRERKLITLLDEGEGQGYAAWRVLSAAEEWQKLVQFGLQNDDSHSLSICRICRFCVRLSAEVNDSPYN